MAPPSPDGGPSRSPDPDHDRRTPLSRLRYGDVQVRTWQVVLAVGAMVALLAVMGFMLSRAPHTGTMTTLDGVTHHCDPIEKKDDGTMICTERSATIVGPPGVAYSIQGS
jgi:hypothetical protein